MGTGVVMGASVVMGAATSRKEQLLRDGSKRRDGCSYLTKGTATPWWEQASWWEATAPISQSAASRNLHNSAFLASSASWSWQRYIAGGDTAGLLQLVDDCFSWSTFATADKSLVQLSKLLL